MKKNTTLKMNLYIRCASLMKKYLHYFFKEYEISAVVLIIVFGVLLRSKGLFLLSLYIDDFWRVAAVTSSDIIGALKGLLNPQPPGFLLVTSIIAKIYNTPFTLKLTSYIPSIAALPFAYLLGKKLFTHRISALLLLIAIAFNSHFIEHANYLKPYSFEVFSHIILLYVYTRRDVLMQPLNIEPYIFTVVLALFALNIHFVLPGIFIYDIFLRKKQFPHSSVKPAFIGLLICLFSAFSHFTFIYSTIDVTKASQAWSMDVHNVHTFFRETFTIPGYLKWLTRETLNLFYNSVYIFVRIPQEAIQNLLLKIWIFFTVSGLVCAIIKRKYFLLSVLSLLWITVLIFNAYKVWPYGMKRVNLFLMVYIPILPVFFIDVILGIVFRCATRIKDKIAERSALSEKVFELVITNSTLLRAVVVAACLVTGIIVYPRFANHFIVQEGGPVIYELTGYVRQLNQQDTYKSKPYPLFCTACSYADVDYYINHYDPWKKKSFKNVFTNTFFIYTLPQSPTHPEELFRDHDELLILVTWYLPEVDFIKEFEKSGSLRIITNFQARRAAAYHVKKL